MFEILLPLLPYRPIPSFILTSPLFSIVPWSTLSPILPALAPAIFTVPLLIYAVLVLSTVFFKAACAKPFPALDVIEIPLSIVTSSFPITIPLNTSVTSSRLIFTAILNFPLV